MLADTQRQFAKLFEGGPAMVDPILFEGSPTRVALGLAVHANTVATARLAALRDAFPRLSLHVGAAAFAALSIEWLERAPPGRVTLGDVGSGFPGFLAAQGAPADAVALALLDQAWLESYHAADEAPLTLPDLAGLDGAALLAVRLRPHRAARLVRAMPPLGAPAPEASAAVLIVRPDAELRILPLGRFELALFAAAHPDAAFGAMLDTALAAEECGCDAALASATRLIGAGAFAAAEGERQ